MGWSGTPAGHAIYPNVDFDWGGGGLVTPTQHNDVSGTWSGKLLATVSGTYTFWCQYDDTCTVVVGGQTVTSGTCCGTI